MDDMVALHLVIRGVFIERGTNHEWQVVATPGSRVLVVELGIQIRAISL